MEGILSIFQNVDQVTLRIFVQVVRYLVPVFSALLLLRCIQPLLTFRREPEIWAWLKLSDDRRLPITHWESIIGSSKRSDVVMALPSIAKSHAVLTRYDDGSWTISTIGTKSGIKVNGVPVEICALEPEDEIEIGGVTMELVPISRKQEIRLAQLRTKATHPIHSLANVLLLTVIQALICIAYLFGAGEHAQSVFTGFAGIAVCQWLLLVFYLCVKKPSFEIEALAFFLCTLGMAAISAVKPGEAVKQLIALVMGLALFLFIGWSLRDLERAKKMRYYAAAAGIGFLIITLLFGKEYHGAKNWLVIGGMSFQPSELSKVCFVFVGASAMDRIVNKRNLILFIGYTLVICACLAVMNDFGTALIFFVAFLLIAYMRSGSVGTVALACTSLGFAGVIALKIAPHALRRFSTWRHIWEDPLNKGYQQTRSLMCLASGGLFGIGAGKGWMSHVFAADSDVVIATIAEEWGLLLVLMMIVCVLGLGLFAVRSAAIERSTFFTIGACAAAGILLFQAILNALGTVDVLPLTGVTFPFVSNGGSSMIGAWGLLAFVKAADTRQNASFAVRQSKEGIPDDE